MQDIIQKWYGYSENFSSQPSELLKEIERFTHINTLQPRMLSGALQGNFLKLICTLKSPKYVLEIGTFTGYSAVCMAEAMTDDSKLITIEINEEIAQHAQKFLKNPSVSHIIDAKVGDAMEIIPKLQDDFDLVFIDADKERYLQYYELIVPKCSKGAIIIADNVLWSGKVLEGTKDKKTQALHRFNEVIQQDPRVQNLILPLRDGLNIIQVL
ncbi:MAG: class I SAM-dependent methyltransferase [Saprospiraceae bacterium]